MRRIVLSLALVFPLLLSGSEAHALLDEGPTSVCADPMLPGAFGSIGEERCIDLPIQLPSELPVPLPLPF